MMKQLIIGGLLLLIQSHLLFAQTEAKFDLDTVSMQERPALLNWASWNLRNVDAKKAIEFGQLAIETSKETDNTYELIKAYSFTGVAYRNLSYFEEALSNYSKGLQLALEADEKEQQCYGYINIANLHIYLNKPDEALKFLDKVKPTVGQVNDDNISGYFHLNYGRVMLALGHYQEALSQINQSLKIRLKTNYLPGQSVCKKYLGDVYLTMQEYDEAKNKYIAALDIMDRENDKDLYTATLNGLARAKLNSGEIISAEKNASLSLQLANEIESMLSAKEATQTLADIASQQADFQKSEQYLKEVIGYNERIYTDDLRKQAERFSYTLENRELAYEKEKQSIQFAEEKKRIMILSIAGGVLLLLTVIIIAWYQYHKRKATLQQKYLLQVEEQNQVLEIRVDERTQELNDKHEELKKLANYKQELTHMIAHDLKNPLNIILGLSDNAVGLPGAQNIRQAGKSMLEMVSNMLDVQKFEEASMRLDMASISLFSLTERARKQVEMLLKAKSITFHNQVPDNVNIEADSEIMIRVFTNLFTNAIKFSEPGGAISVDLEKMKDDPNRIQIMVSDTGVGIEPQAVPHVFDKYFQSKVRKSGKISSTGLGLTFCRMAIEAHDGEIAVTSQQGLGTSFRFHMALSEEIAANSTLSYTYVYGHSSINAFEFDDHELNIVEEYATQLRDIPLYEATKIIKLLQGLNSNSKRLQEWKDAILRAAYNWDTKNYQVLTQTVSA